jgi:hypothetical protein
MEEGCRAWRDDLQPGASIESLPPTVSSDANGKTHAACADVDGCRLLRTMTPDKAEDRQADENERKHGTADDHAQDPRL